ncbi:hypothetical protein [Sphingomonas sp. 1P08PE]|uniref:hypothetical protein n=1 Tax=Sphingomonas sp. 1P08PE TaxID=554122 RepID=UPI0039A1722C
MTAGRSVTLLMTATIAPAGGMKTVLADVQARRDEYARALRFYRAMIGRGIDRIVLVDNSASDMAVFEEIAAGYPIELLAYEGIRYPPEYGYGYGELALIQHAMDHVPGLRDGMVVKVTGRYLVSNLTAVIAAGRGVDFAGDIWNRRRPWLDMRVFMWTSAGFEAILRDRYLLLRDDVNRLPPEMILSAQVLQSVGVPVRTYFAVDPKVSGRRGMDGKDWGRGSLALKRVARAVARPLMLAVRSYAGAARDRQVPHRG